MRLAALFSALALLLAGPLRADTPPAVPVLSPDRAVPMALNLAPITDWGTQQPFLDVMKAARPWIGHLPGRWGGVEAEELAERGLLDPAGWPLSKPGDLASIGTLVLTDLPETATSLAGRYRLRFEGSGIVEVAGRATGVRYGANEIGFDFTPGPGSVDIRIQRSDPRDPVRAITVVAEEHAAAFDAGAVFDPGWLALLDGFATLRFMDWMQTNNSSLSRWADVATLDAYSYHARGLPPQIIAALVQETGADPWVNIPHMADDAFVAALGRTLRQDLPPDSTLYVEYSNEVWNWSFQQTEWAAARAAERWNAEDQGVQFYAGRAAEIADILEEIFAAPGSPRLVNVISTQTGWLGLEDAILNAPLWVAEDPAHRAAPAAYFDAYAVTGYFGGIIGLEDHAPKVRRWIAASLNAAEKDADARGLTGADRDAHVARHRYDLANAIAGAALLDGTGLPDARDTVTDLIGTTLPYHAQVAQTYMLDLVVYEGGSHVVGIGPVVEDAEITAFFMQFNYSAEMGALYTHLLNGWNAVGGGVFAAFNDVYAPTKWGSWGHRRTRDDSNPRWVALTAFRDGPKR